MCIDAAVLQERKRIRGEENSWNVEEGKGGTEEKEAGKACLFIITMSHKLIFIKQLKFSWPSSLLKPVV